MKAVYFAFTMALVAPGAWGQVLVAPEQDKAASFEIDLTRLHYQPVPNIREIAGRSLSDHGDSGMAGPVYEVGGGRILIKPRLKYELVLSIHVLKYAEDHHQMFVPWARHMRKALAAETLREAGILGDAVHEWQLGSLLQDYDGPSTIEGIIAFVKVDESGFIRRWSASGYGRRLLRDLNMTSEQFPEWYGGFLKRYYEEGFGEEWGGLAKRIDAHAKDTARDMESLGFSPIELMERLTGRQFPDGAKIILYPSSFSRPQHAYGFKEAGNKAVLYKIGGAKADLLGDIYHELLHPLVAGWWADERMGQPIAKLSGIRLFRKYWERAGKGSYSYPTGWIEELTVHSIANYMNFRSGLISEEQARQGSYNGYEDALYDAIFDRYKAFDNIDDFIYYAITHIEVTGTGEGARFEYLAQAAQAG